MQFAAQDRYYHDQMPDATYEVVLIEGEPAGRLYVDRRADEIHVVDIALLPEHRGRGLGTRIMCDVLAEADAAGKRVTIYVERFNRALSLYERLGFAHVDDEGVYLLLERTPA